jgi:aryl-alcohol dehydrogenase-like predicted oxidoreductase
VAALEAGINLFDTSPVYRGSEEALGRTLVELGAAPYVETKVMLMPDDLVKPGAIARTVRASVERSLDRLRRPTVDVVHLHNRVGRRRQAMPEAAGGAVLTVADVLGEGGVVETLERLRTEGKVRYIGLGGFGDVDVVHELLESGRFDSTLVYQNLLNPSAALTMPVSFRHKDYRAVVLKAQELGVGVIALRCLAAGVLTGAQQAHPLTKQHPGLDAAELAADRVRAQVFGFLARQDQTLAQAAVRFVLDSQAVASALIGFSDAAQVSELCGADGPGQLTAADRDQLMSLYQRPWLL